MKGSFTIEQTSDGGDHIALDVTFAKDELETWRKRFWPRAAASSFRDTPNPVFGPEFESGSSVEWHQAHSSPSGVGGPRKPGDTAAPTSGSEGNDPAPDLPDGD